ncbi:hypothetical protein [Serratia fonticola]|uniref:hypothetical protein n=1 Tax=Serratia fonticola TaxID=47917 RepID=UPI001AEA0FF3|nr:hypothetical protein [Serratia fonticola]MBP1010764.1 hypothetical protein [Serratia fonticola]
MSVNDVNVNEINELMSKVRDIKDSSARSEQSADEIELSAKNQIYRDGQTRSTLTLYFIGGFFALLLFSCLFVLFYNWMAVGWVIDLKKSELVDASLSIHLLELDKVLSIMISAFGTSLGFIIGYYFKEKNS